jgi:very-short-patch-repair endonuclease
MAKVDPGTLHRARTAWSEEQGCKVVRFTNGDVMDCLDGVMAEIADGGLPFC